MLLLSGQYSTATNCPATSCIRKPTAPVRLVYTGSHTDADFEYASSNRGFQNAFDTLNTNPAPFSPLPDQFLISTIKGHILRSSCRGSSSRYLTGGRFPSCCRWYTSIPFEYASSLRRQGRSRNSCCRYYLEGSVL